MNESDNTGGGAAGSAGGGASGGTGSDGVLPPQAREISRSLFGTAHRRR